MDSAYKRRGVGEYQPEIFPPPGRPLGDLFLGGDGAPDGEWRLTNSRLGFALVNQFPPEQVDRRRLWWRGRRQGQASLGVWSPRRMLAPGESLTLETDYLIQ